MPPSRSVIVTLAVTLAAAPVAAQTPPAAPASDDLFARSRHADPAVRRQATVELAAAGNHGAIQELITMLQRDPDPGVRQAAARAIAGTRYDDLGWVLEQAARGDPDPTVRRAALAAYEELWPFGKRPGIAAALSALCPGCGYFYLRDRPRASVYLGTSAGLLVGGLALLGDDEVAPELGNPDDPNLDGDDPIGFAMTAAAQNLWFYGVFATYRDARLMRGDQGYRVPVSRESLLDLATAPFRPRVVSRPWVWAGVPLAVGAGIALTYIASRGGGISPRTLFDGGGVNFLGRQFGTAGGLALGELYWAGLFLPVGVGEEAVFRGVIQPAASEKLGVWGGWAVASLMFGAIHILNFLQPGADARDALYAVPFITAVGSGMGLASIYTGHQLETSVAMHFWYDFLLGTVSFLTDPDHQPFVARVGFPF